MRGKKKIMIAVALSLLFAAALILMYIFLTEPVKPHGGNSAPTDATEPSAERETVDTPTHIDWMNPPETSDQSQPSAEETVRLQFPYMLFRITNAEGETLSFEGGELTGTMEVLDERAFVGNPADLALTVNASNGFAYENNTAEYTNFLMIQQTGADRVESGRVAGDGISRVEVSLVRHAMYVGGEDIEYDLWLNTGMSGYDQIYLKGKNSGEFSVEITEQGIVISGLAGKQSLGFSTPEMNDPYTTYVTFTGENTLDFTDIAESGMIHLLDAEGNLIEDIPTSLFGQK